MEGLGFGGPIVIVATLRSRQWLPSAWRYRIKLSLARVVIGKKGKAGNSLEPLDLRGPQASKTNELRKHERLYKLCEAQLASL